MFTIVHKKAVEYASMEEEYSVVALQIFTRLILMLMLDLQQLASTRYNVSLMKSESTI